MADWLALCVGALGGLAVVAGALFVAIRPELTRRPRRAWLALRSGDDPDRQPIAGIAPNSD